MLFSRKAQSVQDRRLSPRKIVRVSATIVLSGGRSLPCATVDVSDSGARLQLRSGVLLPERFDVAIPATGAKRQARLVWRSDAMVGVQYVQG